MVDKGSIVLVGFGAGASSKMSSLRASNSSSGASSSSEDIIVAAGWKLGLAGAPLAFFDAPAARDAAAVEAFDNAFTGRGGLNCGPLRVVPFAVASLGGIVNLRSILSSVVGHVSMLVEKRVGHAATNYPNAWARGDIMAKATAAPIIVILNVYIIYMYDDRCVLGW